ncbi:unnamed protein product [Amaranthus hypochondriacus]
MSSRAIRAAHCLTSIQEMGDGVNVACFHPSVGSRLAYVTMEGKLGILQYDNSNSSNCMVPNFVDDSFLEVRERAL